MKNNIFSVKNKVFTATIIIIALVSAACAAVMYFYIGYSAKATEINTPLYGKLVLGGKFTVEDVAADQNYNFGWLKHSTATVYTVTPDGEYYENDGAVRYDENKKAFDVIGVGAGNITFRNAVDGTVEFVFPYRTRFVSPDTEELINSQYPVFAEDGTVTRDELLKITFLTLSEAREYDLTDFAGLSEIRRIIIPAAGLARIKGVDKLDESVRFYVNSELYEDYMDSADWKSYGDRIFPAVNTDMDYVNIALEFDGGRLSGVDGDMLLTSAECGDTALVNYIPVRDGHTFTGWKNGEATLLSDAEINDDIKLTAAWRENSYTVVYEDGRFDSAVPASQKVLYTQKLTIAQGLTHTGYEFLYWRHGNTVYEPNAEVEKLAGKDGDGEEFLLEAAWRATEYTIFYNKNCDGAVTDMPEMQKGVKYDERADLSTLTPSRAGYTFLGWSTERNGEVTHKPGQTVIGLSLNGSFTFYAVWKANTYTVKFDSAGGGAVKDTTVTFDGDYAFAELKRDRYYFSGWYFEDGESCPTYGVWRMPKSVTLTARWRPVTGATYANSVKINVNDDSPSKNGCDTLDLKGLLGFSVQEYMNMGYTRISFTLTVTMSEKEKGYQEVYLCRSAKTTSACVWKKTNIECGGTKLQTTPMDYTFVFDVLLSQCNDTMYVNYGSNGSSGLWWGNDWVKHGLQVVMQVK